MSEVTKLYAVCARYSAAHKWALGVDQNGVVIALTRRKFIDYEIGKWLEEAANFERVTHKDFITDLRNDISNGKYVRKLGWNYPEAARFAEKEGSIFILTIHPQWESRPFSVRQVATDDDYGFHLIEQLYSIRGGQIVLEEFDPEKHIKGKGYIPEGYAPVD